MRLGLTGSRPTRLSDPASVFIALHERTTPLSLRYPRHHTVPCVLQAPVIRGPPVYS